MGDMILSEGYSWAARNEKPNLAGNNGGRTDSMPQPRMNFAAAPQMRPWQAPIPQRDWSFASRQLANVTYVTEQNIFTAAHNRLLFAEGFQLRSQCK